MNSAQSALVPGAVVAAIAFLPFGRMVEIPMGVLSVTGFVLLLQRPGLARFHRADAARTSRCR